MSVLSKAELLAAFATGTTPSGSDFTNLIDSTYGIPSSASNYTTGLSLTQSTTGIPILINGTTYYIPVFTA